MKKREIVFLILGVIFWIIAFLGNYLGGWIGNALVQLRLIRLGVVAFLVFFASCIATK